MTKKTVAEKTAAGTGTEPELDDATVKSMLAEITSKDENGDAVESVAAPLDEVEGFSKPERTLIARAAALKAKIKSFEGELDDILDVISPSFEVIRLALNIKTIALPDGTKLTYKMASEKKQFNKDKAIAKLLRLRVPATEVRAMFTESPVKASIAIALPKEKK